MSERLTGGTSLRARALIAWLRLTRTKKVFTDVDALHESIKKSQRPKRTEPPKFVRRRHRVERRMVHGHPVHTLRPHAPVSAKHVLYLHGGAYVHQIQRDHWKFLSRLVTRTGCAVTVPVYPLAPTSHAVDTVPMVRAVHDVAFAGTAPEDQVFMGDSAGGALALNLARTLESSGMPGPGRVVLISPWLDVTLSDPAVLTLDPIDPYLGVTGLLEAGRLYAGGLDRRDPMISPLFGHPATTSRMSVFVGTRDILLSDARRFRALCDREGVPLGYHEYEGMFHAWVLARIPEAEHTTQKLAALVRLPADA
jgi:monoterpene epsilon-lactone hydrolase